MKTVIHKRAVKALSRMQPRQSAAIRAAIRAVADNPQAPKAPRVDVSRLHGLNALRVRVGDWKVIIKIEGDVLYVTRIRPRGDVYKRKGP